MQVLVQKFTYAEQPHLPAAIRPLWNNLTYQLLSDLFGTTRLTSCYQTSLEQPHLPAAIRPQQPHYQTSLEETSHG